MLITLISIISALLAGMGIGGGAIFVLLLAAFLGISQKAAQILNLILFVAVAISATIFNLKNKNIDFKILKKTIPSLLIGAFIGTSLFKKLNDENLRKFFLYFLVIIGIYEIITSLINIKRTKNNTKSRKEN